MWSRIYILFLVMISFVIFNAHNMGQAFSDIGGLFGAGGLPLVSREALYQLRNFSWILILAILGATPAPKMLVLKIKSTPTGHKILNVLEPVFLIGLLLAVTAYLVDGSFNPFLYFRF